jgi:hypothetical protein
MKEIKLTQGKVALVDDEDFEYLNQFKWYAVWHRHTYYAMRHDSLRNGGKQLQMHRIILGVTDPKILGEHQDHDGLNNQRYNLRSCTNQQNQMNSNSLTGSSRFKGVSWDKYKKKWRATIIFNGRQYYLGLSLSELEMAEAYNRKAKELFGEFANLNNLIKIREEKERLGIK